MASDYDALLTAEPEKKTGSEYDSLLTPTTAEFPVEEIKAAPRPTTFQALAHLSDMLFEPGSKHQTPLLSPEVAETAAHFAMTPARVVASVLPEKYGAAERGIEKSVAQAAGGFTLENLASLPAFAVPGVAELYAAGQVSKLPEQKARITEAIAKHGVSPEAGQAIADAAIQDVMAFAPLAKHVGPVRTTLTDTLFPKAETPTVLAPEVPIEVQPERTVTDATKEGQQPKGNQPEYTGNAPSGAPAEAVSSGSVEPSAQVAPQEVAKPVTVEVIPGVPYEGATVAEALESARQAIMPDASPAQFIAEGRASEGENFLKGVDPKEIEAYSGISGEPRTLEPAAAGESAQAEQPLGTAEENAASAVRPATEAPTGKTPRAERGRADGFGTELTPVASHLIDDVGGLLSKSAAKKAGVYEANKDLWDSTPQLSHPTHNKIYGVRGEMPDSAAQSLYDAGLISEPTASAMYDALEKESKSARNIVREQKVQRAEEKAATPQKARTNLGTTRTPQVISNAGEAVWEKAKQTPDEFTGIDATNLSAADRRELAGRGLSFTTSRDNRIIATYPQRLRAEDLRQKVTAPKLLPGEKQGDLISSTQTEPFALAGEKVTEAPPEAPAAPSLAEQGQNDLFKGFGEETPQSQKIGLLPQPSQFVKTDVAKAVQGAIKGAEQIKAAFAPPNMSKVAGVTARVIRENAAELARKKEMATVRLKDAADALRKNTPAQNLDIINKFETGQTLPTPALNQYKAVRRTAFDERIAQVRAVNPNALQDLIENYFEHIWTRESVDKVKGNLANLPGDNAWARIFGKRPLAGPASFLKERSIPTTADGIAIGLEPVTTNPVALDLLKLHEMDRYVMGQQVMTELKDRGIFKFFRAGSKPDFGYTKIDDRMARVLAPRDWKVVDAAGKEMPGQTVLGDYYAPDDAARVINNYLSPGLKGNAIYDGYRFVGNLMNQVQLGVSMYHATFTAIDSVSSTLALGLEQIVRSGGSPAELAKGGFNIGKALIETPVGSFAENIWRGSKFLKEYSKPGTTNAELATIVDAAVAGGARVRMDTFYKTGAVHSMFEALRTGNYAGATLRAPFAVVEMASKPLMEYAVPRMKLGIISQQLEFELGKLPKNATRDDVRTVAARVVDSVDNRMGQLIYDNLFWNRTLKDGLMASVRSVGWNLGDIREIGGGVWDTVKAPKRAYDSLTKGSQITDNPVFTKRMAYAVALPFYVGVLGSMYQYLMTGEGPKDLQDVYMPRTGRLKADGTAERVMLPTYMKDIYPLGAAAARGGMVGLAQRTYSMALNKLHPALTTIGQMLHNQDYYGNQIRNADDGLVATIQKEADFVGKSFRPFSVQGVIQREGGAKEKGQAVIGLMPAPRELTDTPAMRMMHDINLTKRPAGGYTAAQQQKREDRRKASKGQDLRPELFKRLSKEEKAKVLDVATPEERQIFQSSKKSKSGIVTF